MTEPATPNFVKWQRDNFSNIDEPFAGDHWGRKQFAEHLTGYVGRMKVGATIAIDAEWGAGKTWFVQHWKQHLINEGHHVAYIDAFANDYIDDPFLLIATEIANQVEKKEGKRLKKTAVSVYHAMLPSLPKLIFSAAMTLMGAGLVAQSITETVEGIKEATGDFGEKFAEDMNERIKAQLEEKVQNHEADKKTLESFKQQLIEIASKLDKPLVFIVDELDRCKPEFSIRLIERIKHFFEIPNIVFVLAIHKKQLCESIDSYYGFKSENQYLDKFIDFSFKLFVESSFEENSRSQAIALIKNLGLVKAEASQSRLFFMCNFLCKIYRPTPRQLKSILNKFSLLSPENRQSFKNDILLICFFLKETGRESDITGFKFADRLVKEITGYEGEGTPNEYLVHRNLYQKVEGILEANKSRFGILSQLSPLLVAFCSLTLYDHEDQEKDAQRAATMSFYPFGSGSAHKALDQAWLDYIQRGTL